MSDRCRHQICAEETTGVAKATRVDTALERERDLAHVHRLNENRCGFITVLVAYYSCARRTLLLLHRREVLAKIHIDILMNTSSQKSLILLVQLIAVEPPNRPLAR